VIQLGEYKLKAKKVQYHNGDDGWVLIITNGDQAGQRYTMISELHHGANLKGSEFVAQTRNFSESLKIELLRSGEFIETGKMHSFGPFGTVEPIWKKI